MDFAIELPGGDDIQLYLDVIFSCMMFWNNLS